jgi:hypothetical protein
MRNFSATVLFAAVASLACAGGDDTDDTGLSDADPDVDTDADSDTDTDTDDPWGPSDPVTIGFTGEVATVAGTPLIWDGDIRTARVSGYFTYNRGAPDDDPTVGHALYDLGSRGAFSLTLDGHEITQGGPFAEIAGNTFRFMDGTEAPISADDAERVMSFDGEPDPNLGLWTAFVQCGTGDCPLPEALPAAPDFWFLDHATADYAHTFSITDGDGTLLIQLDEMHVGP